jgi:hypothetical protein
VSQFHADFSAGAAGQLVELFGEDVTYTDKAGAAQTFKAIVYRPPPEKVAGTGKPAPLLKVFVPYSADATLGRTSVDEGGDTLAFPDRVGGASRSHGIHSVLSQAGGWLLRLR